jgi:predicted MFS family arabinose efflux permease
VTDDRQAPSRRSLLGLGLINFFAADVQGGLGPYLTVYLTVHGWDGLQIGRALAASAAALALAQLPAGLIVDCFRIKRAMVIGAALGIAIASLVIARFADYWPVIGAQIVLGAGSAVLPCAISAITLGLVGPKAMADRTARNETVNHVGSFVAASLTGLCGQLLGIGWIFALICGFSIASLASTLMVRPDEIDHEQARGGGENGCPVPLGKVFLRPDILAFLASIALFFFANAAMLPLAGQALTLTHPKGDLLALSGCVVAAQVVMAGAAFCVGRALDRGVSRRVLWLAGFAVLPLRGLLFAWAVLGGLSIPGVIAIQLLDGVASGIFSVTSVVIAADLTQGTGRFNVTLGFVALCMAGGSMFSNLLSGEVVERYGFSNTYLVFAAVSVVALLVTALTVRDSRRDA